MGIYLSLGQVSNFAISSPPNPKNGEISICFFSAIHDDSRLLSLFLFCCFTSQVNSYGHGGTVSSLTTLFSWASLNKQLTSTSCKYFCVYLTTTLLEWFRGREENDHRNYFMINLQESMGLGLDWTRDPWICSQTRICCKTRYQLHYVARSSALSSVYVLSRPLLHTKWTQIRLLP